MSDKPNHARTRPVTPSPQDAHAVPRSNPEFPVAARAIGEATAAVLIQLSTVTAIQRAGILALIDSSGEPPAPPSSEELAAMTKAVAKAANKLDDISHDAVPSAAELLAHAAAQAIAMAMQNTVAASQQLDILAQAVLTRAAGKRLDAT